MRSRPCGRRSEVPAGDLGDGHLPRGHRARCVAKLLPGRPMRTIWSGPLRFEHVAHHMLPRRDAAHVRRDGIGPAVEHVLPRVVPGVHEAIEPGVKGGHDHVVGQDAVVRGSDQRFDRSPRRRRCGRFERRSTRSLAHGFDHGLPVQLINAGGPADQELLDVVDRDRELLTGVVLDDDPSRCHVDDLAPGPLGRKLGQAPGLAHDGIERDVLILGQRSAAGHQAQGKEQEQ